MKNFFLINFILLEVCFYSNAQQLSYQKSFTGSNFNQHSSGIIPKPDGSYVVGGYKIYGVGLFNPFVFKVSNQGNLLWGKNYLFNGSCQIYSMIESNDGGYYLSGSIGVNNIAGGCIIRIDSSGNVVWTKVYETQIPCVGIGMQRIKKAPDNNFIVSGMLGCNGIFNLCLLKIDSSGNVLWAKMYDNIKNYINADFEYLSSGNIYLLGNKANSDSIVTILKTDSLGNYLDNKTLVSNNGQYIEGFAFEKDENDNLVISAKQSTAGGWLYIIFKLDSNLNFVNTKTFFYFGSTSYILLMRDTITNNFSMICDGIYGLSNNNVACCNLDSAFNIIWCRSYNGSVYFRGDVAKILPDKSIIITGTRYSTNDLFLYKTDSAGQISCNDTIHTFTDSNWTSYNFFPQNFTSIPLAITIDTLSPLISAYGNLTTLCISTGINFEEPSNHHFVEIFPNPTKELITVNYYLTSVEEITIDIFNMYGEKIKRFITNNSVIGKNEMEFSLKNFSQGIYFVRMNVDGVNEVRRLVKL